MGNWRMKHTVKLQYHTFMAWWMNAVAAWLAQKWRHGATKRVRSWASKANLYIGGWSNHHERARDALRGAQ